MVIQFYGYFVYATRSIEELLMVIGVIKRVISHLKISTSTITPELQPEDVLLSINCVNNKMRETLELKV